MAIKVGTIQVDLIANTASFTGPLDKAPAHARKTAGEIQGAFNGMDFGEARGGLMLIDELIGVHIPRHASAFASQIPGLMQVAAAAMPVAAIAAIAVGIVNATEKAKQHREEMEKDRTTMLDTAVAMGKHAESIEISNLKLQDQLALLGHKLPQNAVKIAMEEGKIAVDNLITSLRKAIDEETALLGKEEQGYFSKLLFGSDTGDIIEKAKEYKLQIDALTSQLTVARQQGSKQEIDAAQSSLDTQLRNYKKFLDDKRAQDEKDRQKDIGDMRSQNQQIADSYTVRMSAAQKAKAAEAYAAQNAQQEASINEKYAQRGAILNDLTILLNNYSRAQTAQAEHNALEITVAKDKDVGAFNEAQIKKMIILKKAIDDSMALSEKRTDTDIRGIEKANSASIKAIDEQLALYQKIDDAKLKISTLTREIDGQEAIQAKKIAIATGHMTEQKAVQEALKKLEKNKADEITDVNKQLENQLSITQQLDAATNGGRTGTDDQKAQYLKAVNEYQNMESRKLQITKQFNSQIDALRLQLANNERSQWNKMFLDFSQIQTHMSQVARQTLNSMNSSLAAFVVTGQGGFRQLATSAIEEIVKIGLQWVESKLLMLATGKIAGAGEIMTQAAIAGAGGTASMAAAPFPIDLGAPAFGVSMMSEALSYLGMLSAAGGAILPNQEMLVHTHPEEMILPRNISNFIVSAASNSSGSGGGDTHHYVFAPTIHAVDDEGVDRMLTKHADTFHRHVKAHMRRLNYA